MGKAFEIYCQRCKCKVRPVRALVIFRCPRCNSEFLPSQIDQAKNAIADTLIAEAEDTPLESPVR